ncbi:Histidine kinase [Rhodovastum atsumiense]|nr:Histidine kinase [Rhodovastum atsumiense]
MPPPPQSLDVLRKLVRRARMDIWLVLHPQTLLRSAGVRFGLIYAGLFTISALALSAFLWWSTAGLLDRQTESAINADAQGLVERAQDGPLPLIETIQDRLAANIDDDAIYLLADPVHRPVAGNLEQWPRAITDDVEWSEIPIDRAGIRGLARIRQIPLPQGYHLLVGRDVRARAQLRRILADALVWAPPIVVALGTAGALLVRGLFRITIADVAATAAAFSRGDMTRRVRVTGLGDEFDRLAEEINDMLDRIAQLMDGVRQVSNAIAHDLRTPITRARARLEDAANHARDEADLRAAIERAQSDLDGIVAVFQALLRIAEIEAGARRSAFARVDLGPLLFDLAELYTAAAEEREQALDADIPPILPAFGDRDMLQQAVANLLDNALKFSPPGSTIRLAGRSAGRMVEIVVADQGPGIPAQDRSRATERFYRGETARSTPGSGLGLSLVQAVATLHGGGLRLEDNKPGLRAVITLPALTVAHTRPVRS